MIPGIRVSRLSYDELLFVPTPHPLYWGHWNECHSSDLLTGHQGGGAPILNFPTTEVCGSDLSLPFTSAHAKETYDGNLNESGLGAAAPAHAPGGMLS